MDFKRILGIALLVAAAIIAGVGSSMWFGDMEPDDNTPYWWTGQTYTGQIASLTASQIVVNGGNSSVTFHVDNLTRFVLRGESTLTPGAIVQVKYKDVKTDKIARAVRVLRGPATSTTVVTGGSGSVGASGASGTNGAGAASGNSGASATTGASGSTGSSGGPNGASGSTGSTGSSGAGTPAAGATAQ